MIPILYEHGETAFTSNGICRLPDCVSCLVTEVLNGQYECVFEYPMTGKHYDQIIEDRIIYTTHDDSKDPQPFDIYRKSAPMNGVVTFYARHISYRLMKVIVEPYTANSSTLAVSGLKDHSINYNEFNFSTSITGTGKLQIVFPKSVRNALGDEEESVIATYGGEVSWDKFNVAITSRRGMDRDVQLRYGKNLEDIRYESDITNTFDAIVPYWKSSDGKMLKTLPEKIIYLEDVNNGAFTDGEVIFADGEMFDDSESETKATVIDLSSEFDDVPSDASLRAKAIEKFNESLVPTTTIEVKFFELWNTPEYEKYADLQRVFLGDTVGVIYTDLGVNTSKRVVKAVYDSLLERYDSMELGDATRSFGTSLAATVKKEILKVAPTIDIMADAIDHGTELLRGGLGGHVVIGVNAEGEPNEILILDTDSISTAVKVLRINASGIGFSANGYNGTYHSAWLLDGTFYADWITAGTLTANLIKAGILQPLVGDSFINMQTGEFFFGDNGTGGDYISFEEDILGNRSLNIRTDSLSIAGTSAATTTDVSTAINNYDPTTASSMTQQNIFNILTNNSANQGIYLSNGKLYLNFEYAQGQTLKLGGVNNGNGLLEVYNASNQQTGVIDRYGFKSSSYDWFNTFYTRFIEGVLRGYYTSGSSTYQMGEFGFQNVSNDSSQRYIIIKNWNCAGTLIQKYSVANGTEEIAEFLKSSIKLNENTTVSGTFKATGATTLSSLTVSGSATFNSGLSSSGITSNGTLSVTGLCGFSGGAQITGGSLAITSGDQREQGGLVQTFSIVASYNIYSGGIVYGTQFQRISDVRLKDNIEKCESDIIDDLYVVSFDWKKDSKHVSSGFIAQDVQKICPELVETDFNGMLTIDYVGIVPHLVHRVQAQQKEINSLKAEIAEIKSLLRGGV